MITLVVRSEHPSHSTEQKYLVWQEFISAKHHLSVKAFKNALSKGWIGTNPFLRCKYRLEVLLISKEINWICNGMVQSDFV